MSKNSDTDTYVGCGCCLAVVTLLAGTFLVGAATGGIPTSDGYKEGMVIKLSNTGVVWRTWEGQLIQPFVPIKVGDQNGVNNIFSFSVADPEVVSQLQALHAGQQVRLHYQKRIFSPMWKGETGHFITRVERIP